MKRDVDAWTDLRERTSVSQVHKATRSWERPWQSPLHSSGPSLPTLWVPDTLSSVSNIPCLAAPGTNGKPIIKALNVGVGSACKDLRSSSSACRGGIALTASLILMFLKTLWLQAFTRACPSVSVMGSQL